MNETILPLKDNLKQGKVNIYSPEFRLESSGYTENILLPILEIDFKNFTESNQDVINTFIYWTAKIEEIKYRLKPHFTLSLVKNRDSKPSVVANVKWVYKVKGKFKKSPYLSVYIGSMEQYPKGLKDSGLYHEAAQKVQAYLNRVCPLELLPNS